MGAMQNCQQTEQTESPPIHFAGVHNQVANIPRLIHEKIVQVVYATIGDFDMEAAHVFCLVKHNGLLSTLQQVYIPTRCRLQGRDKVDNSYKLSACWALLLHLSFRFGGLVRLVRRSLRRDDINPHPAPPLCRQQAGVVWV